jgi:endonuclease/exonuclease/phosphatase family metal-dependent hydrolase
MTIRIATFNCENLFSRTKVLTMDGSQAEINEANQALRASADLQKLIAKPVYSAADKAKMIQILDDWNAYFTFEVDRGTLRSGNKIVAKGRGDVFGHIRFRAKNVSVKATDNTGKVVKALRADVLCLIEVENREVLGDFNVQVLRNQRFAQHMLIDGNDPRGIDIGLLSNYPIRNMRSHVHDGPAKSRTFSRDCPEYEVLLPDGRSLWMVCNHFKSKLGPPKSSDDRRKRQAARVAELLAENYDLTQDLVVVAGDLNDTPDAAPLAPLLSLPDLHNIVDTLPSAERYTHMFRNQKSQIDYLLVSTPLRTALAEVHIERRGMHRVPGHFPSVSGAADAASDHAAVVAEFNV